MTTPSVSMSRNVTVLLQEFSAGDRQVVDELLPIVYDELRRIAHRQLHGERSDHTLNTTALVHEAYLRLVDQTRVQWQDRAHFCAVAAQAMRRILISYARRRNAQKRGGPNNPLSLDRTPIAVYEQADMLLSLDQALSLLSAHDQRLAQVVEIRFFGGMTEVETAEVLDVSVRTVRRDWAKAKAYLYRELYMPPS